MRKYELVLFVNPDLPEQQARQEIESVKDLILKNQGMNISETFWGKKGLAFLIGKHRFGYQTCLSFESVNSGLVDELQRVLRLTDNVLRFQTCRISDRKRKVRGRPLSAVADLGESLLDDSLSI